MNKFSVLIQKVNNFQGMISLADPSRIVQTEQQIKATASELSEILNGVIRRPGNVYKSNNIVQSISQFLKIEEAGKYDIDVLPKLLAILKQLANITNFPTDEERKNWLKYVYPTVDRLSDLAQQQLSDLSAWQEKAPAAETINPGAHAKQGELKRMDMKKHESLLKRVEFFEKMAEYSDRESFLKSLSQEAPLGPGLTEFPDTTVHPSKNRTIDSLGPGLTHFPNTEVKPGQTPKPPTTGKMYPLPNDGDYINPEVQKALVKLFPGSEKWIKVDGVMGPNTRAALNRYKSTYKDDRELGDPNFQRDLMTKSKMPDIDKSSALNYFLSK